MKELAAKLNMSVYQLEELINELKRSDLQEIVNLVSKRIEKVDTWHDYVRYPQLLGTRDVLMVNIYDVGFSRRALNILERLPVATLYQVKHLGEERLYQARNCGKVVIEEIKELLRLRGHELVP
jgi:DNA-directed RNA polymerase alpha subunit